MGEFDTETDPDCIGDICAAEVQRINIARIIRTPKFTKDTQEDDILLIQLETPAKLNGLNSVYSILTCSEKYFQTNVQDGLCQFVYRREVKSLIPLGKQVRQANKMLIFMKFH